MISKKEALEKMTVDKAVENRVRFWKKVHFRSHITLSMFLGLIFNFIFFLYTYSATDIIQLKVTSTIWWFGWFAVLMFETGNPKPIEEPFKPSKLSIIKDLITPLETIENMSILSDDEKSIILKNGIQQVVNIWANLQENILLRKER